MKILFMKILSKKYIKYYLYEYLNCYNRDYIYSTNREYKQSIAKKTVDYIGLHVNIHLAYVCLLFVSKIQILLTIPIAICRFLIFTYFYIARKKRDYLAMDVVLDLIGTKQLITKTDIDLTNLLVVTSPLQSTDFKDAKNYCNIVDGVSMSDLVKSLSCSIFLILLQYKKYGRRDLLFRNYTSFDFFVACCFFENLDESNNIIFKSTYDKWAYLFANLQNKKVFVQHGIIDDSFFPKRIGCPDIAYSINDNQYNYCVNILFNNKPIYKRLNLLKLTTNDKLLKNGKKNVLIVGNLMFEAKQNAIIELLSSRADVYNIYIKPHPLDKVNQYQILKEKKSLVILDKEDFPKVDLVVSYKSTMVIEYEMNGVECLIYDTDRFECFVNNLEKL